MKRLFFLAIIIMQSFLVKHTGAQQTRGLGPTQRVAREKPPTMMDVDTLPRGMSSSDANLRIVWGKLYNEVNGVKTPAANRRLVLMPNTPANLSKAENSRVAFDDSTVNNIPGAKTTTTTAEGNYEFNNVLSGSYIIRVAGRSGNVIRFSVPLENYIRKKIPDSPANN